MKHFIIIAFAIFISLTGYSQVSNAKNYSVVTVDGNNAEFTIKSSTNKVVKLAVKYSIKARTTSELEIQHKDYSENFIVNYEDKTYTLVVTDDVATFEALKATSVKDIRDKVVELILNEE